MKECFITFRSITMAQRGQSVLHRSGIPARLSRTPRWMEEKGCGYSLRLPPGQGENAAKLLRESAVPFSKRYLRGEDGTLEEIKP